MKRVLLLILLLVFPGLVSARSKTSCDFTLLANLKKIVSNVDITYTYRLIDDKVYFDVTLTNITQDIYFVDNNNGGKYYYGDTNNGIITLDDYTSGKVSYSFYSNNGECLDEKLSIKNISLPYYNNLYNSDLCSGIEDYSLCQKWIKNNYSYYDYLYKIKDYRSKLNNNNVEEIVNDNSNWFDKLISFVLSYYYILMPLVILVILGVIYLVKMIKFRRNRFEI